MIKKIITVILMTISVSLFSSDIDTIIDGFSKKIQIPNLKGKLSVQLISKNGDTREIKAEAFQKLSKDNQMNRLFVFNYPPSVRDTGLLIHSFYNGEDNKMWIYLPVAKRVKRIALENSGGGYFMGSDFSYMDFISKSSSDFTQELLSDGEIDNVSYYRIKEYGNTAEKREALGYDYIINYYGKDDYFLYGRDYYELSGDLLKTYRVKEVKDFPPYIYPTKIVMTNEQTQHRSILNVTDISFKELSNKYFSTRYLQK